MVCRLDLAHAAILPDLHGFWGGWKLWGRVSRGGMSVGSVRQGHKWGVKTTSNRCINCCHHLLHDQVWIQPTRSPTVSFQPLGPTEFSIQLTCIATYTCENKALVSEYGSPSHLFNPRIETGLQNLLFLGYAYPSACSHDYSREDL